MVFEVIYINLLFMMFLVGWSKNDVGLVNPERVRMNVRNGLLAFSIVTEEWIHHLQTAGISFKENERLD